MPASLKRKLLRTGVVLVCLLLIPLLVWRLWLVFAVDGQLKRIRADGLPTNGDELNKWYASVPDTENAALLLTNAFALQRDYSDIRSNLVWNFNLRWHFKQAPRGRTPSSEEMELLAGYLELNAAALAKADEALKLPGCRYPVDCSFGMQTKLPHLTKLKILADVNQYRADVAAAKGDGREFTHAVASILGLGRTLDKEPFLISLMVRRVILRFGVRALERGLNQGVDLTANTNLAGLFEQAAEANALTNALIGERAVAIPYFRVSRQDNPRLYAPLKEGQAEGALQNGDWSMLKLIGYYEMDLGQFLYAMDDIIELAGDEPPQFMRIDMHFAKAFAAAKKKRRNFCALIFSHYGGVGVYEGESVAHLRGAATALAIEQFRSRNGRLPDKLDELTPGFLPEVPEDPYNGKKLCYRRLPKGYVVYSVGRDLTDDGGKELPPEHVPRANEHFDVTFTVER
jgi:hypothetical protein